MFGGLWAFGDDVGSGRSKLDAFEIHHVVRSPVVSRYLLDFGRFFDDYERDVYMHLYEALGNAEACKREMHPKRS